MKQIVLLLLFLLLVWFSPGKAKVSAEDVFRQGLENHSHQLPYTYTMEKEACSCASPSLLQEWLPSFYINCTTWLHTAASDLIHVHEGTVCNNGVLHPFFQAKLYMEFNKTDATIRHYSMTLYPRAAPSLIIVPSLWLLAILCGYSRKRRMIHEKDTLLFLCYQARYVWWFLTLASILVHIALIYQAALQQGHCFHHQQQLTVPPWYDTLVFVLDTLFISFLILSSILLSFLKIHHIKQE